MATINTDIYILGHSQEATISTVGQEVQLNLTLVPQPAVTYGTATGKVTNGTTPIPNAYVKIMDNNYTPVAHTITNSSGVYTFTQLTSGTSYYAYATISGDTLVRSNLFNVTAGSVTNIADIVLAADPLASDSIIAGDLFDSQTLEPINGAVATLYTIQADQTEVEVAITYTNSYGQFVFRELDCTAGQVNFVIRFYALGYEATSAQISLTGATQIGFIQVPIVQDTKVNKGTVSGMITDSTGIISGADVILYTVGAGGTLTPIAFTTTDSHGVYLFFNVSQGTYIVKSNKMTTTTVTV